MSVSGLPFREACPYKCNRPTEIAAEADANRQENAAGGDDVDRQENNGLTCTTRYGV